MTTYLIFLIPKRKHFELILKNKNLFPNFRLNWLILIKVVLPYGILACSTCGSQNWVVLRRCFKWLNEVFVKLLCGHSIILENSPWKPPFRQTLQKLTFVDLPLSFWNFSHWHQVSSNTKSLQRHPNKSWRKWWSSSMTLPWQAALQLCVWKYVNTNLVKSVKKINDSLYWIFHPFFPVSWTFLEANNKRGKICIVCVTWACETVNSWSFLDFVNNREKFTNLTSSFLVEVTLRGPWGNVGGEKWAYNLISFILLSRY